MAIINITKQTCIMHLVMWKLFFKPHQVLDLSDSQTNHVSMLTQAVIIFIKMVYCQSHQYQKLYIANISLLM